MNQIYRFHPCNFKSQVLCVVLMRCVRQRTHYHPYFMVKLPDQMICPGLYFLKEPRTEPDWSSLNVSTTRSSFPSLKWFLKSWLYCLEAKVLEARIPSKLQPTVRDSFLALLKAFQNISLSSSGYKNTFWLEEETELPRWILVLKAVFNFYWTGLSMGKKYSVLLHARISVPSIILFIGKKGVHPNKQKLHRMVETWTPEMWETPC